MGKIYVLMYYNDDDYVDNPSVFDYEIEVFSDKEKAHERAKQLVTEHEYTVRVEETVVDLKGVV